MNRKLAMLSILTILVLTASLLRPTVARAEDEIPPDPAATEEPVTVPEILEQAPEGTEIVVVNAEGETEPLATQEAAEIIAASDPIWCPGTETPLTDNDPVTAGIQNGCTPAQATVTSLLATLTDPDSDPLTPTPYTGAGIIYFQEGNYTGLETLIEFDHADLASLDALTLWGGWDLNPANLSTYGTQVGTSLTTFSVPVTVTWNSNVTLNDIAIAGSTSNGLVVTTPGNINLDQVSVTDAHLTGAYLDSCQYGVTTPGICDGTGTVTVTNSSFYSGDQTGLIIDSGGDVTLTNMHADENALDGAVVTSADANGAGNVNITNSGFEANVNGTGLTVVTGGTITLAGVYSGWNNNGVELYATYGTTAGPINVTDSSITGNTYTGLHAESDGTISLDLVSANYNGSNGAYLVAKSNVTVAESIFSNNVNISSPADPGLYVESYGYITLTDVVANNNLFGTGAVLKSLGGGNILVDPGFFNGNGIYGIQAYANGGDITLNNIVASYNAIKGAYLNADTNGALIGNIFIYNSTFVENGAYGIYATADEGNTTLDIVTVLGSDGAAGPGDDNLTNIGAFLTSWGGGNILVTGSIFVQNTETGLVIVGSDDTTVGADEVTLQDILVDENGDGTSGNGVEIYSTYTYGCRCPDDTPVNIDVFVDGGTFTNNTGYGLRVIPGPAGTLTFVTPPTTSATVFAGNLVDPVTGEQYLLDLNDPEICTNPCACAPCPCDNGSGSGGSSGSGGTKVVPQTVDVPFKGMDPVEQDCTNFLGTVLQLPDGTWVKFGCPFTGYTVIEGLNTEDLPAELGAGITFLSGIDARMFEADGVTPVLVNPNGALELSFKLPEDQRVRSFSVLYWDPTANDNAGTWISLPPYEVGTQFPLYPDNPEDQRLVLSGVKEVDGTVTFKVNFPGIFILVTP